jgi:hypothetical protein
MGRTTYRIIGSPASAVWSEESGRSKRPKKRDHRIKAPAADSGSACPLTKRRISRPPDESQELEIRQAVGSGHPFQPRDLVFARQRARPGS